MTSQLRKSLSPKSKLRLSYYPTEAWQIDWRRPERAGGHLLRYYHQLKTRKQGVAINPTRMFFMIILYKFTFDDRMSILLKKSELFEMLFQQDPQFGENQLGYLARLIQSSVYYDTHYQERKMLNNTQTSRTYFKLNHILDLRYGLEVQILEWLPWYRERIDGEKTITTSEAFATELEIISTMKYDDLKEDYFHIPMRWLLGVKTDDEI